ncbi:hypothetical protein GW17_00058744 [Ensete ventricosum]|nr:hypothetical protein GW17_00058744 [Ensete ventricosum]
MCSPVRAVHTGPPVDRYAYRPLSGGIADWSCFRPIITRNRPLSVDFDHRRPLSGDNDRFRAASAEGGRKKKWEKKKRERKRQKKNLESALLFPYAIYRPWAISSPRVGRRNEATGKLVDAYRVLHNEKDTERCFSWSGNPIGKMRIDYFIVSEKLKDRIVACEMHGRGIELEGKIIAVT